MNKTTRWPTGTVGASLLLFGLLKLMGLLVPGMFRKQNLKFLQNFKAFAEEGRTVNGGQSP